MSDALTYDPGPPNCMECGAYITGLDGNGRLECLAQNGGWEWWVYCQSCDVETFSQTFTVDGEP